MKCTYHHLFGPVPSRRLGRSLGVDLTPFKTCSFNCVFCQLGSTTHLTLDRKPYIPAAAVTAEIAEWLKAGGTADYVTLAGSGEPTLNSEFGDVIQYIRSETSIPVALLTNGSLLSNAEVRRQAARANLVKISLSAWDQTSLRHVNRPHPDVSFEELLEGQRLFRKEFDGELWLEVFLVWGTNTTPRDVSRIAELVKSIGPDIVHLNTAVRPPCEEFAYAVPREQTEPLTRLFDPPAEVAAEFTSGKSIDVRSNEAAVLGMLERRPCTLGQICQAFGLHPNEATKYVGKLLRTGQAQEQRMDGNIYYRSVGFQEGIA